jgi:hypothetical protein
LSAAIESRATVAVEVVAFSSFRASGCLKFGLASKTTAKAGD